MRDIRSRRRRFCRRRKCRVDALNDQASPEGKISMHFRTTRVVAATLIAALALTSLDLVPAQAAPKNTGASQVTQDTAATTEMSARRRWRRGNRAALGAFLGFFGTVAAIATANQYRNGYYFDDPYYGPYVYGAPYGYAPGYRYRDWRRHHRQH
jgi:hypothetical protein